MAHTAFHLRANGEDVGVESDVAALKTWTDGHEKLCLERHRNILTAVEELREGQDGIKAQLSGLNKAAWSFSGTVALTVVGLIAWFVLQVWPVQSQVERLTNELPARTANRYTAQEAQADRERYNNEINKLQQQLRQLQSRPATTVYRSAPVHRRSARETVPY